MTPFLLFALLQILDAATTLVFLRCGVAEANPLVRFLMGSAAGPEASLAAAKLTAVGVAFWAVRTGRDRLIRRCNLLFALVVVWNVFAILAAPGKVLAG